MFKRREFMYGRIIEEIIKESNGRLQIENIIVQAGQKVVRKGIHSDHGEVVLKLGDYNIRIEQEYEIIQSIKNENFPKIYDFQNRRGIFYILEEYIPNGSLSDIKNKILYQSEEKIIELLKDIVIQMTPIWEKNIVHRDLKPANILIRENGTPVVIDFGIAKKEERNITKIYGVTPKTLIYAPPEQYNEIKKDMIDLRTDFYSLGIIALELILGHHPFFINGEFLEDKFLNCEYEFNKTVSDDFKKLISKLANKKIYKRFRNSKIFYEFLLDMEGNYYEN